MHEPTIVRFHQKLDCLPQLMRAPEQRNNLLWRILNQLQMAGQQIECSEEIQIDFLVPIQKFRPRIEAGYGAMSLVGLGRVETV